MRINEIEMRLSAIRTEMDAEGADIEALSNEVDTLLEERKQIIDTQERRMKSLEKIAGLDAGNPVIEKKEEERMYDVNSMEYRAAWLKNLQGKELDTQERAAMQAGATIPTVTQNKIVSVLDNYPIINAVDVTYIPGNVSYAVEDASADASWLEMGTAATDSEDNLVAVTLNAYKLIKTIEITANVQALSIDAFEAWLVSALAAKISAAVASAILNGNGVNKATGILKDGVIENTANYSAKMTWAELMAIIGALPSKYAKNASFVASRTVFYGQLLGMEDQSGNRVVVADAQAPGKFNILGYPVVIEDNAGDAIVFGDLKMYKFNFGKAPEVSADASVGFRNGSVVYRALALADGKPADKNAFVVALPAVD